ncbi:MAG TPA: PEGA domain-containing protein [Polyangia bacterium]|nr:PEGA domain-containing protein [Polyangia bacterium]
MPGWSVGVLRRGFFKQRVPRIGSFSLTVVLVAVSLMAAPPARPAAEAAEAETLIGRGIELRQQGKDDRALPLFLKAYKISPSPRAAGQLGLVEMALGYWLDSEQHLGAALELPDHPWVSKHRQVLEQALTEVRTNIGEITVEGSPAGATVTVNRLPAGALPLPGPVRVAKGPVDVEVSAAGYLSATRSIQVSGAERQHVTVNLGKTSAEKVEAAADESHVPEARSPATVTPPHAPSDDRGLALHREIGWGLGIAADVGLIGGAIETIVWQNDRGDFNGKCFADMPPSYGPLGCSSLYKSLNRAETIAIVGYASALVLGVGAVIAFANGKDPEAVASGVACAPEVGVGPAFVRCHWTF